MTTTVTVNASGPYFPNGATLAFPFDFKVASAEEITVELIDAAGVVSIIPSASYGVALAVDGEGGVITMATAPVNDGRKLWIVSDPYFSQDILFEDEGPFNSAVLNPLADRSAIRDIWLKGQVERAVRFPRGEAAPVLPSVAARAGKFLGFDGGGDMYPASGTGADGALRADIAQPTGLALNGFLSQVPRAITRSALSKGRDWVSVLDFGADPTGVADSTDAFNRASQALDAHTGNDTTDQLRMIHVPAGRYKLGGTFALQKTFYLRKGQQLRGDGTGATHIRCEAAVSNTVPVIECGWAPGNPYDPVYAGPGDDPGGLAAEISGIWFFGGPAAAPVVKFARIAGYMLHACFFTSCGIALSAGGSEGLIINCVFDQGLIGLIIDGQNILVTACLFYQINLQIIAQRSYDCAVSACHFEYPIYNSIQVGTSSSNADIKSFVVRGCTFLMNAQYATFTGFIAMFATNANVEIIGGNTFRNCYGPAIRPLAGVGNRVLIDGVVFDGAKSNPVYDQGTTMKAVACDNMYVTMRNFTIRNMPAAAGSPITVGGSVDTQLSLTSGRFQGNAGGASEINITNPNGGGAAYVLVGNIEGGGRPLFNAQAAVPVSSMGGLKDWLGPFAITAGRRYVGIPHQAASMFDCTIKANVLAAGNPNYRKASRFAVDVQQGYDGSNVVRLVGSTTLRKAAATSFLGELDVTFEMEGVGGGTTVVGTPGAGYIVMSWPDSYGAEVIDVQLVV